jgi:hypothetical protein
MKTRILLAATTALLAVTAAQPARAETKMPDVLINEWCSNADMPPEKVKDGVKTSYLLPSWTTDGHCTNIFAITPWDFWLDGSSSCTPMKVLVKEDTAPSGTGYEVTVSARCYKNGQQGAPMTNTIETFKFERYKGSMSVTTGSKH